MAEQVILNLPDRLAKQVHEVAALTQRKLEDILIEWLDRGSLDEVAIGDLSDEQILKLCELQMSEPEQTQMSLLLEKQRESLLQQGETIMKSLARAYSQTSSSGKPSRPQSRA